MKNEIKIGIIFLLSLISLFIAIFFIKDISFEREGKHYVVRFAFLDNLLEGGHVKLFGGIRIGTVLDLYHNVDKAEAKIIIYDETINKLIKSKKPKFKVNSASLLGEKYLLISFDSEGYTKRETTKLEDGEEIPLFHAESTQNINTIINKLDKAMDKIDKGIIEDLGVILKEIRTHLQSNEMQSTITNLYKSSDKLNNVLLNANKLVKTINTIAKDIDDVNKPIGRILKDEEMAKDLKQIISNIEQITNELKTHPLIKNQAGKQGPY